MVLANGTYLATSNNCVMCKCSPANYYTLQCLAYVLQPSKWTTCPSMHCSSSGNLTNLGNFTTSSCSKTTCAYAGYTEKTILTTPDQESTCPAKSIATKTRLQIWSLALVALVIYSFVFSS